MTKWTVEKHLEQQKYAKTDAKDIRNKLFLYYYFGLFLFLKLIYPKMFSYRFGSVNATKTNLLLYV